MATGLVVSLLIGLLIGSVVALVVGLLASLVVWVSSRPSRNLISRFSNTD